MFLATRVGVPPGELEPQRSLDLQGNNSFNIVRKRQNTDNINDNEVINDVDKICTCLPDERVGKVAGGVADPRDDDLIQQVGREEGLLVQQSLQDAFNPKLNFVAEQLVVLHGGENILLVAAVVYVFY